MIRNSTWLRLSVVLALAVMVATACGTPAPPPQEEGCKVAILLPSSIADQGYSAAAYAGLLEIGEKYGCETAYSEFVPLAEHEETFRDYASQGYDVLIGHGFEYGDAIEVVAPDFPDAAFLVVNGIVSGPNYASLLHENHQASYVAGHICARMSETDKLGAIGGFAYPVIIQQLEAFKLGAQSVNPDIEVTIAYVDSWEDIALGKEAALAQISTGADCIFHVADTAGLGVIQACDEGGVRAVGFATDQNPVAPDTVITSTIIDYQKMLVDAVGEIMDDTFEFNTIHYYGLDSGLVKLADYHGLVPDDIAAEAEEIQQQIISGDVEVPLISEPTQ